MIVKQPDQKFPTAPEGTFPAVCVDEIDLGMVTQTFNGEEKTRRVVRLVWQIDEDMPEAEAQKFGMAPGSRYLVKADHTASLDEKANLRKQLQSWRGRAFTSDELQGFDLENIVGAPCNLSIVHNSGRKGGVFANVAAVTKLMKGQEPLTPMAYVRVKDRKPEPVAALVSQPKAKPVEEQPPDWDHGISDDDVPF